MGMPPEQMGHRLLEYADAEAQRAKKARVAQWKDSIQTDLPRLARWVAAKSDQVISDFATFDADPDPQAKAERAAAELSSLWSPADRPDPAQLSAALATEAVQRPFAGDLRVEGPALFRRARAAAKKAGGLDGWTGSLLRHLPLEFFQAMADIWNAILQGASIPRVWKQIKVVLLPKPDGGNRPLAIASFAWRLGASEVLAGLADWTESWLPLQLYGGVPNRSADQLHARLHAAVHQRSAQRPVAGCKADVRKCFDRVHPEIALRAMEWWGAPSATTNFLRDFYSGQERFVCVQEHFAAFPTSGSCSLLQGCPFSPFLLNCLMAYWSRVVEREVPGLSFGVFLDDRTLWACDRDPIPLLSRGVEVGARIDRLCGFELHPNKLESFGTSDSVREGLMELADTVGIPQVDFKLLGVRYRTQGQAVYAAEDITSDLKERGRRIRMVALSSKLRARLVAILMISKFRFCAPWVRFLAATIDGWTSQVEMTIWGRKTPSGRSACLFWNVVAGLEQHPRFALHSAALTHEWRRLGSGAGGTPGPRVGAALQALGWQLEGNSWATSSGAFSTGHISERGFRGELRRAWRDHLWAVDTKTGGPISAGSFPVWSELGRHTEAGTFASLRVACGAAQDGRDLQRLGGSLPCRCGVLTPSRHHLTFDCIADAWTLDRRTEVERRMLTPLVHPDQAPPSVSANEDLAISAVVQALMACPDDEIPILALDGGAISGFHGAEWQRASWAVAGPGGLLASGEVPTFEQSAAAGERWALRIAALAVARVGREVRVLQDNLALVVKLSRWKASRVLRHRELWTFWDDIATAIPWLLAYWVPSHGKKQKWCPPVDWPDASICRQMNDWADKGASAVLDHYRIWISSLRGRVDAANKWAADVVRKQARVTEPFQKAIRERMSDRRHSL
ncbi:unnamed protein product [Effrenium voratum]|nr:unnamed protein product [Effrenium voratum]